MAFSMDAVNTSRPRNLWSEEEDCILREEYNKRAVRGPVKDWKTIAMRLPGRSNKDCRKRWMKLDSSVTRGSWNDREDELLRQAVSQYGTVWTEVARAVDSRNADQCAKRWLHFLNPDLDMSEWTEEDDAQLLLEVEKNGHNWRKIVNEVLSGRSPTDAKNRYTILQRSRKNNSSRAAPRVRRRRITSSTSRSEHSAPQIGSSGSTGAAHATNDMNRLMSDHGFHRQHQADEMTAVGSYNNLIVPQVSFDFSCAIGYFSVQDDRSLNSHYTSLPVLSEGNVGQIGIGSQSPTYSLNTFASNMPVSGDSAGMSGTVPDIGSAALSSGFAQQHHASYGTSLGSLSETPGALVSGAVAEEQDSRDISAPDDGDTGSDEGSSGGKRTMVLQHMDPDQVKSFMDFLITSNSEVDISIFDQR